MSYRDPRTQLAIIDASSLAHASALRGLKELLFTKNGVCIIHYVSLVDKCTHRGTLQDRILVLTAVSFMLCDSKSASRCFPILDMRDVYVFSDGFIVFRVPSEHDIAIRLRDRRESEYMLNVCKVLYYFHQTAANSRDPMGPQGNTTLNIVTINETFDQKKHSTAYGFIFTKKSDYFTKVIPMPVLPWSEVSKQQLAAGQQLMKTTGTDADPVIAPLSNRSTQIGPSLSNPDAMPPPDDMFGPPVTDLLDHPLLRPSSGARSGIATSPKRGVNQRVVGVGANVVSSCISQIDALKQKQDDLFREQQTHMRSLQDIAEKGLSRPVPPPTPHITLPTQHVQQQSTIIAPPPLSTMYEGGGGIGGNSMSSGTAGLNVTPLASFKGATRSVIVVPGMGGGGGGAGGPIGSTGSVPRPLSFDTPVSGLMAFGTAAAAAEIPNQHEEKSKRMMMCLQDEVVTLRKELREAVDGMKTENMTILAKDLEIKALRDEMSRLKREQDMSVQRMARAHRTDEYAPHEHNPPSSVGASKSLYEPDYLPVSPPPRSPSETLSPEPKEHQQQQPQQQQHTLPQSSAAAHYFIDADDVRHLPPQQRLEARKRQLNDKRALIQKYIDGGDYDAAFVDDLQAQLIALIRVMQDDVQEIEGQQQQQQQQQRIVGVPPPPQHPGSPVYTSWSDYFAKRQTGNTTSGPLTPTKANTPTKRNLFPSSHHGGGGVQGGNYNLLKAAIGNAAASYGGGASTPSSKTSAVKGGNVVSAAQLYNSPGKRMPFR